MDINYNKVMANNGQSYYRDAYVEKLEQRVETATKALTSIADSRLSRVWILEQAKLAIKEMGDLE